MVNSPISRTETSTLLLWEKVSFHTPITEQAIITNLSTSAQQGELLGVIGASGSGKSTFLKLCNYLLTPTVGDIYYRQQSLSKFNPVSLRREIVLVLQEPKLLGMTVKNSLIYPLQIQGVATSEIKIRLRDILELFSVPDSWLDKKEGELSLGQRQIIAIARGLMMQPQVLLLDEPTSALDQGKAEQLGKILVNLAKNEHKLIIVANHHLNWVGDFATRVLILKQGKLVDDVSVDEVNWEKIKQDLIKQTEKDDFADF